MRRLSLPWTVGTAAAAIALTLAVWSGHAPATLALASSEGVARGQLWRLVSGPLVHSSAHHLFHGVLAFLLLGALCEPRLGRRYPLVLLACLALPTVAVLALQPELGVYYGLSGTIHGLLVAVLVATWRTGDRAARPWLAAVALGVTAKIVYEAVTGTLVVPVALGAGIAVVPLAHAAGALVGALCALARSGAAPADAGSETSCTR